MGKQVTGYLDRFNIKMLTAVLRTGGIVVLPTDTIYGFHCAVSKPGAVERIRRMKGRGAETGMILLACDFDMVGRYVSSWPGDSRRILSLIWPASLTAILPSSGGVHSILAPAGKVALRVPAADGLRRLIQTVGEPIVSTSVNLSGQEPLKRMHDIKRAFPGLGAYISRKGRPGGLPSTVVDFTFEPPRCVRRGLYPWASGRKDARDVRTDRGPRCERSV